MAPRIIAGVDFSGAKDVPNATWIAVGRLDGLGLEITELTRTGSHALASFVASMPVLHALGLDFPFSLPAEFIRTLAFRAGLDPFQSWQQVVEHLFTMSFEDFQSQVVQFKSEPKRLTDQDYKGLAQSPLHRGNPSMVQMTYYGMRFLAMLNPERFHVLPFHDPSGDTCAVLEVFPGGTLSCLGLPGRGYKSKEKKDRERVEGVRREILDNLIELRERHGILCRDYPRLSIDKSLQHQCVESDHALDAVIACYTTAVWLEAPDLFSDPYSADNEDVLLEGWIYAPLRTREAL